MPLREAAYTTQGVNLPPFFAGLLPEGLRLQALIGKAGTSSDDLFTLLAATGPDCVGDVYATLDEQPAEIDTPSVDLSTPAAQKFDDLEAAFFAGARDASVAGVQPKLSAALMTMPVRGKGTASALLKLSPKGFPLLVENEAFFMNAAKRCGLIVPDTRIIADRNGRTGLLVARFDRKRNQGRIERTHQEDACQFCDRYPADKYRLSLREITEAMIGFVDAAPVQVEKLLKLVVFSYFIGNGDLHAKNISIYKNPTSGLMEFTPAYDLVSTLAYKNLDQRMALLMDGKDGEFRLRDFVIFFGRYGLPERAVQGTVAKIASKLQPQLDDLPTIGLSEKTTRFLSEEIARRISGIL